MIRTAVLAASLLLPAPSAAQEQPTSAASWSLEGTAVDVDGQPIDGAGLVFGPWREVLTAEILEHPQARSGVDGRFHLTIDAWDPQVENTGILGLQIAAPGRSTLSVQPHALFLRPLDPNAEPGVIELGRVVLAPGREVFGRVRDPDGRPIAGVRVTARDILGDFGYPAMAGTSRFQSIAETDASGIFRLQGVPSWGLKLELRREGYYRQTLVPVAHGTPLQIELRPSGFVSGRVLGPDGRAVQADLAVQHRTIGVVPGSPWQFVPRLSRTDADGAFRLGLELPGPFRVAALAPQGLGVRSVATDWMTEPGAEVELRLEPPGGRPGLLVEAVSRRSGESVGEVRAGAMWDGFPDHGVSYLPLVLLYARDRGAAGSVLVSGPGPGEADRGVLFVDAPGHAPFVQKVAWLGPRDVSRDRPRRHRVTLEDPCSIAGRLVRAGTGDPLAGIVVWATPQNQSFFDPYVDAAWRMMRSTTTSADGSFRLAGLASGTWSVRAGVPGCPIRVSREVELHREDVVEGFDLEMPAGRTVELVLPGFKGGPGAVLEVLPETDESVFLGEVVEDSGFRCRVPVDAGGRAHVPELGNGRWSLLLRVPQLDGRVGPLVLPLASVEVQDGIDSVVVDTATSLPGTVTGELRLEGADVPRHRLLVLAVPDADGVVVTPLQAFAGPVSTVAADGSFRLTATPGDIRLYLLDLGTGATLAAGDPFVLEPGTRTRQNLSATLAELTVGVQVGGSEAWPDHVELSVLLEGALRMDWIPEGYTSGVGRSLAEGEREVVLYVPIGDATVRLRSVREKAADSYSSPQLYEVLDEEQIRIENAAPLRVTLRADANR